MSTNEIFPNITLDFFFPLEKHVSQLSLFLKTTILLWLKYARKSYTLSRISLYLVVHMGIKLN
jgi:hypothetical protein